MRSQWLIELSTMSYGSTCVRWYLRYPLSYRDLEEMMRERGLHIDHTTIYRSRTMLRTRTGEALQTASQSHESFVARR
jgi:transposase-like protein